jgi:hypothetical protein
VKNDSGEAPYMQLDSELSYRLTFDSERAPRVKIDSGYQSARESNQL